MKQQSAFIECNNKNYFRAKLWLVEANQRDARVAVSLKNKPPVIFELEKGTSGLLACEGKTEHLYYNGAVLTPLSFQQLCKLQAFIDESLCYAQSTAEERSCGFWPLSTPFSVSNDSELTLDFYFLSQFLSGMEMGEVSTILRQSEEYALIRYLLQVSDTQSNLDSISARYGLSPSHFRRLMRNALGNGVKAELKKWRLTRALLASFQDEKRLTDTAMNYGYASLSHFSTEVKKLFGMSHRQIKQSIINESMK